MNKKEGWPPPALPNAEDHLSPEINKAFEESEMVGGFNLEELKIGDKLLVSTSSKSHRTYTIERRADGLYISGHPQYCPTPVKATIPGSTFSFKGGMLRMNFVGPGVFMEFIVEGQNKKTTSRISEVKKVEKE